MKSHRSRQSKSFEIAVEEQLLNRCLSWVDKQFEYFNYFTANDFRNYPFGTFEHKLFATNENPFIFQNIKESGALDELIKSSNDWIVGFFCYEANPLSTKKADTVEEHSAHPNISFFIPELVIHFNETQITIETEDSPEQVWQAILQTEFIEPKGNFEPGLTCNVGRSEYLEKVTDIINLIEEGEFYEMNLCMEFTSDEFVADPIIYFLERNRQSLNPFTCLQKYSALYTLCFSPERFLKKHGEKLISQPIKGTIRRGRTRKEDEELKKELRHNEKEQAENLMIVDLVRNDLNRSSKTGSVSVDELFGIYSFQRVNQMISTVSSTIESGVSSLQAIDHAFPMGSMTGAPKLRVRQQIATMEAFRRDLFSGSIGYFKPDGDFDFNVVIRTIFLDRHKSIFKLKAGSAITYDSIPEKEYEECLLKVKSVTGAGFIE
jgi:para-aminobenzoate synthetase component 1